MGCLIILVLMGLPRLALLIMGIFTTYWSQAFDAYFWPILGWIFLPWTTLAYMIAVLNNGGVVSGAWVILVVFGVLLDLGGGVTVRKSSSD